MGIKIIFHKIETGEVSPETTKEQAQELVSYAKESGIEFYSVATGLYWEYSITSDDAAEREKAKKLLRTIFVLHLISGVKQFL